MTEVGGQIGAEVYEVTVGVAVQVTGQIPQHDHQVLGETLRWRVRILVRVEPDRDIELRSAVRRQPAQVLAQRQAGRRGQPRSCGGDLCTSAGRHRSPAGTWLAGPTLVRTAAT